MRLRNLCLVIVSIAFLSACDEVKNPEFSSGSGRSELPPSLTKDPGKLRKAKEEVAKVEERMKGHALSFETGLPVTDYVTGRVRTDVKILYPAELAAPGTAMQALKDYIAAADVALAEDAAQEELKVRRGLAKQLLDIYDAKYPPSFLKDQEATAQVARESREKLLPELREAERLEEVLRADGLVFERTGATSVSLTADVPERVTLDQVIEDGDAYYLALGKLLKSSVLTQEEIDLLGVKQQLLFSYGSRMMKTVFQLDAIELEVLLAENGFALSPDGLWRLGFFDELATDASIAASADDLGKKVENLLRLAARFPREKLHSTYNLKTPRAAFSLGANEADFATKFPDLFDGSFFKRETLRYARARKLVDILQTEKTKAGVRARLNK